MSLPNFLIVGAAKSSTTSLYHYLSQHPDVYMSPIKEPGFLTAPEPFGVIDSLEAYKDLFDGAKGESAVGEASPIYLPDPYAPERIVSVLGEETKILIVLRNPIDMVYSLWQHRKRELRESHPFIEAIQRDLRASEGASLSALSSRLKTPHKERQQPYPYVFQARYASQVSRYQDRFEEVKVMLFEEVVEDASAAFAEICRFLCISDEFQPAFKKYNQGGEVRSTLVHRLITDQYAVKEMIKKVVPLKTRVRLKQHLLQFNVREREREPLTSEERAWLAQHFEEDVARLDKLVHYSLRRAWPDFQVTV